MDHFREVCDADDFIPTDDPEDDQRVRVRGGADGHSGLQAVEAVRHVKLWRTDLNAHVDPRVSSDDLRDRLGQCDSSDIRQLLRAGT